MHFVRAGRGAPPLVFVHGFGCSHEDWLLQTNSLAKLHDVVACDLRGHGLTPGRAAECSIENYGGDVAALLDNLDLPKAILIGHSMGCRVVLEANRLLFSSNQPGRVAGLVLIDGSRLASGDAEAAEGAARAAIDKAGYAAFALNLFRQMFFQETELSAAIVARGMRLPDDLGSSLWVRMARWDAAHMDAALAAVRVPLMVIQSTTRDAQLRRSSLKPAESSPWLDLIRQRIPAAKIEIIPGAGHFPQLEAPAEVNRLLAGFLRV